MNRHVNAIAGRLSLRPPQRDSLEILHRVTEILPPRKDADVAAALASIRREFPEVEDFERDFPSLCFALATGVGKTRLMGAFISYLHLAHGINNFFVLAPNLTIYKKLIADFTPNTPKYVFRGIAEFATDPPEVITGEDYEAKAGTLFDQLIRCKVNIFNISKINSEVRGGKAPRIKRLSEYIGESYFEYLANLPDLVLLMDESHRYRASAGVRAINELRPLLGLELTATPLVETARGVEPFKNVIYDYALGRAMEDGFVKEPAVVTRKDFSVAGMQPDEIERLKLEDGIRLHESVKVELETYARQAGREIVKPFVLVIARDTTHAGQLLAWIQSDRFLDGRYRDKAIQVDSSKSGRDEDEMIERLLRVEQADEPTEIVIHVNMLKEGWDVTNLYTIVPLRAANARVLIEQSIGRGLRLPYGKRTGVAAVDTLNIVAHDRFQEIIDEANRPGSKIRMKSIVLDDQHAAPRMSTVVSQPRLRTQMGFVPAQQSTTTRIAPSDDAPAFAEPEQQKVAQIAYDVIRRFERSPAQVPTVGRLREAAVQRQIVQEVRAEYVAPPQLQLEGMAEPVDIEAIVSQTTELVVGQTIDIPRILVVPRGEVRAGFRRFDLDLSGMGYAPVSDELWIQTLHSQRRQVLSLAKGGVQERRPEDYVVSGLIDFDDVCYDDHADLLYDLAEQVVRHLQGYLGEDEAEKVLRCHQRDIARFVHVQMQPHYWEDVAGHEVKVSAGFSELKPSAYSASDEPPLDYRQAPADKSNMARYLFGGFRRCLYDVQKFGSDPERRLAVILERESVRWFKPARGQFQLFYRIGGVPKEYQPDFVAETDSTIFMLEPKARREMDDAEVVAKAEAATIWCSHASVHAEAHGGKPWRYVLVPHDAIADNMTLAGLAERFGSRQEARGTA